MKEPIRVEARALTFSSTPILQYSTAPKQLIEDHDICDQINLEQGSAVHGSAFRVEKRQTISCYGFKPL